MGLAMIYIGTKICSIMHQNPPFHSFHLNMIPVSPTIQEGHNLPLVTELTKYTGLLLT